MVKCELQEGMGLSSRWWFTVMEAGDTSGRLMGFGVVGAGPCVRPEKGNNLVRPHGFYSPSNWN